MREILFRGKRNHNGEWVYGIPVPVTINCYVKGVEIIDTDGISYDELDGYNPVFGADRVDPETVGQFTGLTDKNGTKIFEGDIICYAQPDCSKAYGLVKFCEHGCGGTHNVGFSVDWFGRYDSGWLRNDVGFWAKFREIEVIGNIHDNPELLGGD